MEGSMVSTQTSNTTASSSGGGGVKSGRKPDAEIRELILAYIAGRDLVSFAELQEHVESAGFDASGDVSLVLPGDPNLVVWVGLSEGVFTAVESLLKAKTVFLYPCSWLTYLTDGKLLTLPTAKRPPRGGYKNPHWVPAVLRLVPF